MKSEYLIVFCTVPNENVAHKISKSLVSENLAACVNIVKNVRSIYRWESEICDEGELLLIIKTTVETYESLEEKIQNIHPYEVPEILAIPVFRGNESYLAWIDENMRD
jgi:periplasmic divalent cation tolerance protein